MPNEFKPEKYIVYNPETKKEEPQFKRLEDIPEEFRDQFKEAPDGGYVRTEAIEDEKLAGHMADAEVTERDYAHRNEITKQGHIRKAEKNSQNLEDSHKE